VIEVHIAEDDAATVELWQALADLVETLPPDWVLIGGLMVQLHAFEHGVVQVRVTGDIDVLGEARPQRTLRLIDQALEEAGFDSGVPDPDGYAHRYKRGDLIVDVMAPDGTGRPPSIGSRKAVGVPGGSQALRRSEEIRVEVAGRSFHVRRPTLLGAILIKARSLRVHVDPDSQREDLVRLLALVEDPRVTALELSAGERNWLAAVEDKLAFGTPGSVDAETHRLAALTYALLVRLR
jgi:hypothetical protein